MTNRHDGASKFSHQILQIGKKILHADEDKKGLDLVA
jgi:hypothetical protein